VGTGANVLVFGQFETAVLSDSRSPFVRGLDCLTSPKSLKWRLPKRRRPAQSTEAKKKERRNRGMARSAEFIHFRLGADSWAVIAEVAHFLDGVQRTNLYRMIEDAFLHTEELKDSDATRLIEITRKYPRADLGDATLVVLAERLDITQMATTDRTDFAAYRTKTGRHFNNVFRSVMIPPKMVSKTKTPIHASQMPSRSTALAVLSLRKSTWSKRVLSLGLL